jgi:decaprenylphospho-beta-D-erythro-pentofuranosid-2-ulose 2-reductase
MRVAIIGGSAGLGRALAEEAARRRHHLLLVSSDQRDLNAMAAHLRLIYSVEVNTLSWHFAPEGSPIHEFVTSMQSLGPIDSILFPIGAARSDDTAELDENNARAIMESNCMAVANIVSALLPYFRSRNTGWIVGFGSIASVRGRSHNVFYAASKRALMSYFESLQRMLVGTGVRAQFYVLGYIDTPRIAADNFPVPKWPAARTARAVFSNLDRDKRVFYYPWFWNAIALILRILPWSIFCRLTR